MPVKFSIGILAAVIIVLSSIFIRQANAEHCYEGLRDCIPECNAAAPGSGGGASLECLTTCNEYNNAIFSRAEECVKQEQGQGEEQTDVPQQQQEQPRSTRPEQEDATSDIPSPSLSTPVRRLVAGLDIKEGEEVTANQGELLLIDFREGNFVEVNSGASFTYGEEETKTIFEVIKGSLRFLFEPTRKIKTVHTSSTVATIRGTDFVVNEEENKTEVLVFDGKLAVSDIDGNNTVEVDGGYKTEVKKGGKPTKPELFDSAKIDRWFDAITPENSQRQIGARTWTIAAVILAVGLAIIFFGIKKSLKHFRRRKKGKEEFKNL